MEQQTILIVDDDREIVRVIAKILELEGYRTLKAYDGLEALDMLVGNVVHLIMIDIMMPKMNGLAAVMKIRETNNIPIIILSAKTEETDKVLGLSMGADDYISKPFNTQEMIARVKAQLRRYMRLGAMNSESMQDSIRIGDLYLDKHAKELNVNGESVHLTATEYKIMELLMSNPGRVFPAEEIYERVWQEPAYSVENTVMVHIRRIREKIEINPKQPKYLKVVWGIGTKLKKMTANIKGIKGWFVLTVLGLDVLLGIDGGNLISTFYGDVIIYVAFLATVTAGIMLTISLRPDSKEWPFFGIFDNFKTDTLFWLELLIVTCTMAAFAWIAGLYESWNCWSWAYSAISILGKLLFLVLVLPEAFVAVSCYAIFIRRMKDREKRRVLWIQSVFPKHEKKQKVKKKNPVKKLYDKFREGIVSLKVEYEHSLDYEKKQLIETILIVGGNLIIIWGVLFADGGILVLLLLIINIVYFMRQRNFYRNVGEIIRELHHLSMGEEVRPVNISETSPLYEAGCDLEKVNESLDKSVKRQIKSEQMKIELITNVSHDLKTPLTSIIGYIDLLKKEDMSPEAQDYVNVISKKSEHLKEMIQDLFEISKATSGNAELVLEKLDMVKLLQQTLGDMEDRISSSGRIIRTVLPEEPLYISGDGKRLYRVYQNLMENALKYSMEGTRIYVEGRVEEQKVITEIKNIAAYEMDFTADKIVERFQRGDVNRTTEGHGLGLAIAKSFSEACGGHLDIIIDGDMFKAVISYPLYWEN